ncbi:MAG: Autophagy-related 2 [Trebouxia sp. A1-2]|nr:MAG: Autophagy-related 2 [Trebouxia sp. A1-2]
MQQPGHDHEHMVRRISHTESEIGTVEWHGATGEGHLRVMDGVQEDAFKRQAWGEGVPAASVFLEGGWFPPEQQDVQSSIVEVDPEADQVAPRTMSGSAPAVNEDYICPSLPPSEVSEEWDGDPSSEEKGVWFGDPNNPSNNGPHMEEDYVQLPVPGKQGTHGFTTGRGAIGPLPASHPTPLSRLVLRDLKLLITLNHEEEQAGRVLQAEPNNGRLEVDLEGVSLQLDTFRPEGTPYAWRLAFSIHQLEVRDHVQKGNGKPPRWRRMVGYHFMARTPRDPAAVMLQVELEAVKPDGPGSTKEQEFRLSVALLPLRLRIDQNMVTFLQGFFTSPNHEHGAEEDEGKATNASSTVQEPEGSPPFLQKVEIQAFSIVIDYQPRRLDAAALRSGSFMEVLNLVPWGGVQLDLPHVKASGLQGWGALGSAVGNAYLQDIASSQVHKFVVGVAPVRSLCRVGWAAKQLLSIPADQLRSTSSSSHSINNDVALTRQLRRGVTTLARAVTLEALGLGASVAGGADFVLRGGSGSGADHPAGLKEGLKQAAQGLTSGLETAASALVYSPVRSVKEGEGVGTAVVRAIRAAPGAIAAPASAAAAATRVTLLGMRNALDPDRYEERRR